MGKRTKKPQPHDTFSYKESDECRKDILRPVFFYNWFSPFYLITKEYSITGGGEAYG